MFIYQGFESEEMVSGAAFFFKTNLVIINYVFGYWLNSISQVQWLLATGLWPIGLGHLATSGHHSEDSNRGLAVLRLSQKEGAMAWLLIRCICIL